MSYVRFEPMPAEVQPGEVAAALAADPDGWIIPPVRVAWQPEPPRAWRTTHLRNLQRRGMVAQTRYRRDGAFCVRLNSAGLALRQGVA